ncbi:MAG: hypothetical protein LBC74_14660 [Planctomycetaceae bacterium]|jgi:hypothetical protein|nr:hypothetical protein [Planctomycetaceae bacterium]
MIKLFKSKVGDKFSVRLSDICEVWILFFIFCVFGGTPVPDVNEPYYIGKAIHFWDSNWVIDDTFLDSKDSHWAFYFLFGWLSFFMSPYWMAITGRFLTWFLLALAWRHLCFTIIRVRWSSVPAGLAMAYYVSEFNMAGEWIIGGVEGKSFAFPFVLFALAELVRGHWGRVWIFLGVASAFHVLVGGWSAIAAIIVHIFCKRKPDYYFMIVGGLVALPGIIPCLLLDYGTVGDIVQESHRIYVFERLSHHLVPYMFTWTRVLRFLLLVILWIFCCRFIPVGNRRQRWFDFFVWGTLIISLVGFILAYVLRHNESMSATVLRLYWFRMSDIAVPMGIAIGSMFRLLRLVGQLRICPPRLPRLGEVIIAATIFVTIFMITDYFLFGGFMFSWKTVPYVTITWCITVLLCRLILYVVSEFWGGCPKLNFSKIYQKYVKILQHKQNNINDDIPIVKYAKVAENADANNLKIWLVVIYAVILVYMPFGVFTELADSRTRFSFPKSESKKSIQAYKWREVCDWISDTANTPKSAKFFIPFDSVTFKWYANRSNVAVWKEVPQDAKSLIQWARSIEELFGDGRSKESELLINKISKKSFSQMLIRKTPDEIRNLQKKYRFNYILAPGSPDLSRRFGFTVVYKNSEYCVYKIENDDQ